MNSKSIVISTIITVALIASYHFALNNKKKPFSYIDTNRIMTEYKGMEDVQVNVKTKMQALLSTIDTLGMEIQNEIKLYEKERSKMTKGEKAAREELLGHKQQQFMQYRETTQKRAAQEEQKITGEALSKINSLINDYGKDQNYAIIFGTSAGSIIYATDALDITDEVLEMLNKQYEKNNKK